METLNIVLQKRRLGFGDGDLFAAFVQYSIGRVQRRQGRRTQCISNLTTALQVTRDNIQPRESIWIVDQEIEHLIAYREFGMLVEAQAMFQTLEEEADLDSMFNRKCQVVHVQALLLLDRGHRDQAITLLQNLVISANRKDYNRALLWAVLDLATILRKRDRQGDWDQAQANFDGIIVDLNNESTDWRRKGDDQEPNPPRLLKLAEESLKLVRGGRFDEVERLFQRERVGWFREEDLWLWMGAPAADTTSMKSP